MESRQPPLKQSDELDLTQIFTWIGNGFRKVGDGILDGIAGLRNSFIIYRVYFTIIIIVGLFFAVIYAFFVKKDYYKSTMVLNCNYLNTQVLTNIVDKLNLLAHERNRNILMRELSIDSATAKNILKFEFRPFISEDEITEVEIMRSQLTAMTTNNPELVNRIIERLRIENKDAYQITVIVLDPEAVQKLEKTLIQYLKNNTYIQRRMEINSINLQQRKEKLVDDSEKLDSLKKVLMKNYQEFGRTSRGSNNVILGTEGLADPLNVFAKGLEINEQILDIDEQLYLGSDFEVVDPFTTFRHSESVSLPVVLAVALLTSVLAGYLMLGVYKFDQMLARHKPVRQ